jgi:hypothetical protein
MGILADNERIELTCVTEVNVFHAFEKKIPIPDRYSTI